MSVLYFNATLGNEKNNRPIEASYLSYNNSPILDNQSNYYGSIIRVNVNQMLIPITIFKVQTPVNDINLGIYSFTLTYENQSSEQTYLIYQPTNNDIVIPKIGTSKQVFNSNYYYIYSYQNMVDMMNVALKTAYQQLSSLVGGGTLNSNNYPYILYNNNLQQLELHTPIICDLNGENPLKIYCNTDLNRFLHGFNLITNLYNDVNGKEYLLNVRTLPDSTKQVNVSGDYITMQQEASCLSYWNSLRNVFITSNLSIINEFSYDPKNNVQAQINIITDYIPDSSPGGGESFVTQKQFIYNAASLYRMFEFSQVNSPLTNINLNIVWSDNDDNIYPLYIFKGFRCDIKLMFIKKNLFNNII